MSNQRLKIFQSSLINNFRHLKDILYKFIRLWNTTIKKEKQEFDKYNIKVKYNPLTKGFEVFIKILKDKFDTYFSKGANKLTEDEDNKKEVSEYMTNLYKSLQYRIRLLSQINLKYLFFLHLELFYHFLK